MPVAAITAWLLWWYLSNNNSYQKSFEGEILKNSISNSRLNISEKKNFYVFFNSISDLDDTYLEDLQAWMG